MRSDVRFWEGRRDAPAARLRRGSVHLARYLISTTTRGDAAFVAGVLRDAGFAPCFQELVLDLDADLCPSTRPPGN